MTTSTPKTIALNEDRSLNCLRKTMTLKFFKNSTSDICTKLLPTSDSFIQHCLRAWRQVYTWKKAFEQYDLMQHHLLENYGYHRENDSQLSIQWITIPSVPNDISLIKCFKCPGGCQRCRCAKNKLPCTPFCGCSIDQCTNRPSTHVSFKEFR